MLGAYYVVDSVMHHGTQATSVFLDLVQRENTERKKPDGIMTGQTQKG
jgi:hypothetical protein